MILCDLACVACASEMARSDGGDTESGWIDEPGRPSNKVCLGVAWVGGWWLVRCLQLVRYQDSCLSGDVAMDGVIVCARRVNNVLFFAPMRMLVGHA